MRPFWQSVTSPASKTHVKRPYWEGGMGIRISYLVFRFSGSVSQRIRRVLARDRLFTTLGFRVVLFGLGLGFRGLLVLLRLVLRGRSWRG